MNQKLDLNNEIVFASSDPEMSHAISRFAKEGRLKRGQGTGTHSNPHYQ